MAQTLIPERLVDAAVMIAARRRGGVPQEADIREADEAFKTAFAQALLEVARVGSFLRQNEFPITARNPAGGSWTIGHQRGVHSPCIVVEDAP